VDDRNITIYDIAREAGVSPSTVSRVLTNNANVRSEKRKKVQDLIEKYNFKPSALARGLSDTKRHLIGIIAADIRNTFYAEVFVACEKAAEKAGYTVLLLNSFGDLELEKKLLSKLMEQRVDAIIQLGGAVDDLVTDESYAEAASYVTNSIPMVVTGKLEGVPSFQVRINVMQAMDELVEHLMANGNERIAMIGGRKNVISTYDKFQHLKALALRYNLDCREEYINNWSGYTVATGVIAMEELLSKVERTGIPMPDAIIAISDQIALGALQVLKKHKVRVPQDVSLVSFDNIETMELVEPSVTSVDYDFKTLGEKLVDTAISCIEQRGSVNLLQFVDTRLVVRESSDYNRRKC